MNNTIYNIYERPVINKMSRLELWEKGKAFGASITPSTYSKKYRKEIVNKIIKILSLIKSNKLLSIGLGNGFIEKELIKKKVKVLGIDVSKLAIKLAKQKGIDVIYGDANKKLKLKDKYGVILLEGSIGHLIKKNRAVYLFKRIKPLLIKNGAIIIANDEPLKRVRIQKHNEVDFYWVSKNFIKEELNKAGCIKIKGEYINYFRPTIGKRRRIFVYGFKN